MASNNNSTARQISWALPLCASCGERMVMDSMGGVVCPACWEKGAHTRRVFVPTEAR